MISDSKYLIFLLFITACSGNSSNFSSREKKIFGKSLDVKCTIGVPAEIVSIDSLLLFYDRYEQKTITIYDIKNNRLVCRFLNEGQGPNEILPPLKLSVSILKKELYVFQMQTGCLNVYNVAEIAKPEPDMTSKEKFCFEERPANVKKLANNFVGIGFFEKGRYHTYDELGNVVDMAGVYPFNGERMDAHARFFLYQGHLCASSDQVHFVLGTSYSDNLEFYEVRNNKIILLKKYETYDVKARFEHTVEINDNCIISYKGTYPTDKHCYMLYSGKLYADYKKDEYRTRKIIVFDWKGNYIRSFEADNNIFSFCVDENEQNLYAITEDEGGYNIMRFKL